MLALLVKLSTTTEYISVPIVEGTSKVQMLKLSLNALAETYKLDYDALSNVVSCEGQWNPDAYNPNDPTSDGSDSVESVGLLQFKQNRFKSLAEDLGIEEPDITNPFQQLESFVYAWSQGNQRWWSCSKKVI